MYIISYLGSDSNWHEQHEALTYDEAIVLKAEGERHGDIMRIDRRCEGHPAGPYDTMGETVYCDGTCLP